MGGKRALESPLALGRWRKAVLRDAIDQGRRPIHLHLQLVQEITCTLNLLDASTELLVNAVITEGVMGRGPSLAPKQRLCLSRRLYPTACRAGQVWMGRMFAIEIGELAGPRWIVNLPTTQHGRQPPQLARVTVGRAELHRFTCLPEVRSIAIPAVGAAIGYLD